jgi:hypothetical protein
VAIILDDAALDLAKIGNDLFAATPLKRRADLLPRQH